ncbi:hypothetical protein AB0H83_49460 [Dactylosporangium sp. NPDC050688]|uniref:hypothetical protein n=1 Tax=Dactylosporangium sp. NPDC050688 TaxID=3157217 RepID=UPI0033F38685
MASPLFSTVEELAGLVREPDLDRLVVLGQRLLDESRGLAPDELTAAVGELAEVLKVGPYGEFARLALVARSFVLRGGSPLPLVPEVVPWIVRVLALRVLLSHAWPTVRRWRWPKTPPDPASDRVPEWGDFVVRCKANADRFDLTEAGAVAMARSWRDIDPWLRLLHTAMERQEFRAAVAPLLPELTDLVDQLAEELHTADCIAGLARVLDDAPLVVLDADSGRGYHLTMSGIGDNCQLHTLLADRLIGDPADGLILGLRPQPAWVAAATTGPAETPFPDHTLRRFRLFDGTGAYLSPEGRPSDIAERDGVRVVVAHPPRGNHGWLHGRRFVNMVPTLALDEIMTPADAAAWHASITPARQDDFLGP